MLNALANLLNWYAVCLGNFSAVLINDRQPFLRYRRRAMHNQVSTWNTLVNGFNSIYSQNIPCGWAAKFIGAMAGATGNSQGIYMGFRDKVCRLFRVGEHLIMG